MKEQNDKKKRAGGGAGTSRAFDKPNRFEKTDKKDKRYGGAFSAKTGRKTGAPKRPFGKGAYERTNSGDAAQDVSNGAVPGRNAVRELLKSGRDIEKIFVSSGDREGSITMLVAQALERGIPVIETDRKKLDTLCGYEQHQGIVAIASEKAYVSIDDVLTVAQERGEKPLLVICDGISDPHNLGAIIRCAEGAGAHGVILPKRRAAGITPAVVKASAGATEHIAAVKCANITDTIRTLKEKGLWIFAAEACGEDYTKADFDVPCAIVLGSEENGVSELVKKNSDYIVSIPMNGKVNSLNVSTACAVLLYEAIRKRGGKP